MLNNLVPNRRRYAVLLLVFGVAVIALGLFLQSQSIRRIYHLPIFLDLIGLGICIYGGVQFSRSMRNNDDLHFTQREMKTFFLNNAILIALMLMIVVIAILEPRFLQLRVLRDILSQSSPRLILALGMCFTLMIAGTDLSVGRMVGLSAVISASMMQTAEYGNRFFPDLPQLNIIIPIVLSLLACMFFGLLNGILVARFNLHPFIATLALAVIVYGSCSLYFDMPPNNSQPIGGVRNDFAAIGQTLLFGTIPILIPIALFFTVLIWFVLNMTVFGKNVYAIGGNRQAAEVSGVNVRLTLIGIFVISAFMAGVVGILEAARTAGATNNYGNGYELDAIAACVVGGVSLNGGVGRVSGIVIGVLIFTVIQYGLSFVGLNPQWQQVIKGIIIAVAVALDMAKYKRK